MLVTAFYGFWRSQCDARKEFSPFFMLQECPPCVTFCLINRFCEEILANRCEIRVPETNLLLEYCPCDLLTFKQWLPWAKIKFCSNLVVFSKKTHWKPRILTVFLLLWLSVYSYQKSKKKALRNCPAVFQLNFQLLNRSLSLPKPLETIHIYKYRNTYIHIL